MSFALQPDGVHPGLTGHWLMRQALLEAWKAPARCAEVVIDAAAAQVVAGEVRDPVRDEDGSLRFTRTTPLPMPMNPRRDARSIALEQMSERLNRHRMTVVRASWSRS